MKKVTTVLEKVILLSRNIKKDSIPKCVVTFFILDKQMGAKPRGFWGMKSPRKRLLHIWE